MRATIPWAPVCRICGCREVRTDEVVHGAPLLLGECPRCNHRFTALAAAAAGPAPRARRVRPVAPAA